MSRTGIMTIRITLVILLPGLLPLQAQVSVLPFFTSPADTSQYGSIKGSPYLYDDWKYASMLMRDSTEIRYVLLNYNGYENRFELFHGGRRVTFNEQPVDRITVFLEDTLSARQEWFVRGVHYDMATRLANVLYDGQRVKLIRQFEVRLVKLTEELPGTTLERYRFGPGRYYYLLYEGVLHRFRLSKVKVARILNNKRLINEIVDEEGLDPGNESDMVRLLQLYENYKQNR